MSTARESSSDHCRAACREELPLVLRLLALLDADGQAPLDLAAAQERWDAMARYPSYQVMLLELEGETEPKGTYSLLIMDNLGHRGAPSAIVENVAIDPAFRGQGLGRLMMEDAMARAAAAGCYKLVLSSNDNRVDAHAFYTRLGFRRHGTSFHVDL
jgi:GNAT superfamily N-acetyltransferase